MNESPQACFVDQCFPKPSVAVIIVRNNMILLAKRAIEPAKGKFDIIGGFIERDESAEDAARREVLEETGLKVRSLKYLGSIPDIYGEIEVPTINFCFVANVEPGDPHPQSDVASVEWFEPDKLPQEMAFVHQYKALQWYKEKKK